MFTEVQVSKTAPERDLKDEGPDGLLAASC